MLLERMIKARETKILGIMFGRQVGSVKKEICKLMASFESVLNPGKGRGLEGKFRSGRRRLK